MAMKARRVFLLVLDSFGIGALPDAAAYGDAGSNTLASCRQSGWLSVPTLESLGLFHIDGVQGQQPTSPARGAYGRLGERSAGKDTTTGHWEIAGQVSEKPFPTFPEGFPPDFLAEFSRRCGRGLLCNKPYSGTQVIHDYGRQQLESGDLIVYTSADSVFQIAANEDKIPLEELYADCRIARELLQGDLGVGRVIARPFRGSWPNFVRTANRRDFSLAPSPKVLPQALQKQGFDTLAVGKIWDIFAGQGFDRWLPTHSNDEGMAALSQLLEEDFRGLAFINLVDFDMLYGHRNDVAGYTKALNRFDGQLGLLLPRLGPEDVLLICADHGCDPATPSTDHSREYVPLLIWGPNIRENVNLSCGDSFGNIAATVAELLGAEGFQDFCSYAPQLWKEV